MSFTCNKAGLVTLYTDSNFVDKAKVIKFKPVQDRLWVKSRNSLHLLNDRPSLTLIFTRPLSLSILVLFFVLLWNLSFSLCWSRPGISHNHNMQHQKYNPLKKTLLLLPFNWLTYSHCETSPGKLNVGSSGLRVLNRFIWFCGESDLGTDIENNSIEIANRLAKGLIWLCRSYRGIDNKLRPFYNQLKGPCNMFMKIEWISFECKSDFGKSANGLMTERLLTTIDIEILYVVTSKQRAATKENDLIKNISADVPVTSSLVCSFSG